LLALTQYAVDAHLAGVDPLLQAAARMFRQQRRQTLVESAAGLLRRHGQAQHIGHGRWARV
jgi:hypothetical protein